MKLVSILFLVGLGVYYSYTPTPNPGVVIEKLHYPPHLGHKFEVANGEWLCPEEPSNNVYLVDVKYVQIPDQWILKVAVTNNLGKRDEVYIKCPYETWRYSNCVGKVMTGYRINEDIYW